MKCCRKLYGTKGSMTKQSRDFQKLIFTTISHNSFNTKNIGVVVMGPLSTLFQLCKVSCVKSESDKLDSKVRRGYNF